jgi:ferrous iron transport protein B
MSRTKALLIGNPNSGKSTIFNNLTGLRQKTANFPGVTVEKKIGFIEVDNEVIEIIDLPGTYSLFPNSKDEKLVCNILCNPANESYPDAVIYVADANQLERHLLLCTQIRDLGLPMLIVLNMIDILEDKGNKIDIKLLQERLGVPVIISDARSNTANDEIKKFISNFRTYQPELLNAFYPLNEEEKKVASFVKKYKNTNNLYQAKLIAHHHQWLDFINVADAIQIKSFIGESSFLDIRLQIDETMVRLGKIQQTLKGIITSPQTKEENYTLKLDNVLTNKIYGPLIFFALMLVIFQSIFTLAEIPMTWIESGMTNLGDLVKQSLPAAWYTDLIVNGIIAGLAGVIVFIPQITLLFLFLSMLEESGYMSRVVYMFDHIMQKVGLNGRSMVALISSGACAIPAIMSTRTIGNWKERLITILVAPIIPCSARIPVYTVLIALMIPASSKIGIFNLQGIAFMGLYILGIAMSLIMATILKVFIKTDERSYLMIELPQYKKPLWSNVFYEVKEKVLSFLYGAGKIILIVSIFLWFLASFGPRNSINEAKNAALTEAKILNLDEEKIDKYVSSKKLEASYAGIIGKFIEPVIKPLGFDWKIGIALITSFAAREVFVGTMATIYNIGNDAEVSSVRDRMAAEFRTGTTKPMYDIPTSFSLIIFYAFAMQCMSTLAVTKKETNGWKWAIIQFLFLTILAYISSFIVYNVLI